VRRAARLDVLEVHVHAALRQVVPQRRVDRNDHVVGHARARDRLRACIWPRARGRAGAPLDLGPRWPP
jgi:hypothetical protein